MQLFCNSNVFMSTWDLCRLISVSRQLMEFAHTGRVDLMPRTIIGVICAADHYEFIGDIISIIMSSSCNHN